MPTDSNILYLASASPRRAEILNMLGYRFEILPAEIDESGYGELPPKEQAGALCRAKAAVVAVLRPSDTVLGSDTVVAVGTRVLGKPKNPAEAALMLKTLSGKTHTVYTGVCVRRGNREEFFVEAAEVTFYELTEQEIARYVSTGEPMDKAGAYGIQGRGSIFVKHIRGNHFCVMGLPAAATARLLSEFGIECI